MTRNGGICVCRKWYLASSIEAYAHLIEITYPGVSAMEVGLVGYSPSSSVMAQAGTV